MLSRQRAILEDSDIFIVLPGGVGTVSELFDCMMLNDVGSYSKPIIIFNPDNYYDEMILFIEKLYNNGASKKSELLVVSSDNNTIISYINSFCKKHAI